MKKRPTVYEVIAVHELEDGHQEILELADHGEVIRVVVPSGTSDPEGHVKLRVGVLLGQHPNVDVQDVELYIRPFA